ncbi:hypothetical protein BDN72DRAFT_746041, partial [Pluteus cervinus]
NTSLNPAAVFQALHFAFYNRYCVHGKDYDPTADPASIQTPGKKRVNSGQFTPRASQELHKHPLLYGLLQQAFSPVFAWIEKMIETHLPAEYEELRKFIDVLPVNDISAASPFAGFVINLNVATHIHRDWQDQSICVVMVISECTGGELVLLEPGIVLNLRCGDMVVFPSSKISHFNTHF